MYTLTRGDRFGGYLLQHLDRTKDERLGILHRSISSLRMIEIMLLDDSIFLGTVVLAEEFHHRRSAKH